MIIFDLDGTLANCEHRRHFVEKDSHWVFCEDPKNCKCNIKPDWKAFYEACDKDEPIQPVIDIFHDFHRWERKVQIWSGRCESVRQQTKKWLIEKMDIHFCSNFCLVNDLKMRPIGDNTPDDQLKERWLDEYIAAMYPILGHPDNGETIYHRKDPIEMVFDDRPKVIHMWRRRGIFVFNCCQHDEEF